MAGRTSRLHNLSNSGLVEDAPRSRGVRSAEIATAAGENRRNQHLHSQTTELLDHSMPLTWRSQRRADLGHVSTTHRTFAIERSCHADCVENSLVSIVMINVIVGRREARRNSAASGMFGERAIQSRIGGVETLSDRAAGSRSKSIQQAGRFSLLVDRSTLPAPGDTEVVG